MEKSIPSILDELCSQQSWGTIILPQISKLKYREVMECAQSHVTCNPVARI